MQETTVESIDESPDGDKPDEAAPERETETEVEAEAEAETELELEEPAA